MPEAQAAALSLHGVPQVPASQKAEQQSPSTAQAAPLAVQPSFGLGSLQPLQAEERESARSAQSERTRLAFMDSPDRR